MAPPPSCVTGGWSKQATLTTVVGKTATDAGYIRFDVLAKDDDKIGLVANDDYDVNDDIMLEILGKTFISDGHPGKIKDIGVEILEKGEKTITPSTKHKKQDASPQ